MNAKASYLMIKVVKRWNVYYNNLKLKKIANPKDLEAELLEDLNS